jgi:PhoH-like ATPase
MSKKTFILDTNVLLHDSSSLFKFGEHTVLICFAVLAELDTFKKQHSMNGYNAREVSRHLDKITRQECEESEPGEWVQYALPNQGHLLIRGCDSRTLDLLPSDFDKDATDNILLAIAQEEQVIAQEMESERKVVIVSKDINVRVKARSLGTEAEDYLSDKSEPVSLYTGSEEFYLPDDEINFFYREKSFDLKDCYWSPNVGVTLISETNPSHTALARVNGNASQLNALLPIPASGISRIKPLNREQHFALDLLLRDDIKLVTLIGKAGTGKTLLAIAAGLHQVADEKKQKRLLVARPIVAMGNDLGYLPGEMNEKLAPWMRPIWDNFDLILGHGGYKDLVGLGLLQVEALPYIRGRSIPHQYFIVDEAQNLTPHEVKTIITRAGEGTKIVLTGDPEQIDNPYVDAMSNGLSYVVDRFRGDPLAGHITLTKGERSELAERATVLL